MKHISVDFVPPDLPICPISNIHGLVSFSLRLKLPVFKLKDNSAEFVIYQKIVFIYYPKKKLKKNEGGTY